MPSINSNKKILEEEIIKTRNAIQTFIIATSICAWGSRKLIECKLRSYKVKDRKHEKFSFYSSFLFTPFFWSVFWGTGKAISTRTWNGTKAGLSVGFGVSLFGLLSAECISFFFKKRNSNHSVVFNINFNNTNIHCKSLEAWENELKKIHNIKQDWQTLFDHKQSQELIAKKEELENFKKSYEKLKEMSKKEMLELTTQNKENSQDIAILQQNLSRLEEEFKKQFNELSTMLSRQQNYIIKTAICSW